MVCGICVRLQLHSEFGMYFITSHAIRAELTVRTSVPTYFVVQYVHSVPLDSAGETAVLVAHDGLHELLGVEQRLGWQVIIATACGNSLVHAHAT